jgi:hypothetical protein
LARPVSVPLKNPKTRVNETEQHKRRRTDRTQTRRESAAACAQVFLHRGIPLCPDSDGREVTNFFTGGGEGQKERYLPTDGRKGEGALIGDDDNDPLMFVFGPPRSLSSAFRCPTIRPHTGLVCVCVCVCISRSRSAVSVFSFLLIASSRIHGGADGATIGRSQHSHTPPTPTNPIVCACTKNEPLITP